MLTHPTIDTLHALRLPGMARAFEEQLRMPEVSMMTFEDRLGLLVEREATERSSRRLASRLRTARLRQNACLENVDLRSPRGLDRTLLLELGSCRFIAAHTNVVITGPTGVGKTFLACALAHRACLEGYRTSYVHMPKLHRELAVARGDGRHAAMLDTLAKVDLLVLDDLVLTPLADSERRDLYAIVEERHDLRSTIATSQLPVEAWHRAIGDPNLADSILDRLTSQAHRIALSGESRRSARRTDPHLPTEEPHA